MTLARLVLPVGGNEPYGVALEVQGVDDVNDAVAGDEVGLDDVGTAEAHRPAALIDRHGAASDPALGRSPNRQRRGGTRRTARRLPRLKAARGPKPIASTAAIQTTFCLDRSGKVMLHPGTAWADEEATLNHDLVNLSAEMPRRLGHTHQLILTPPRPQGVAPVRGLASRSTSFRHRH